MTKKAKPDTTNPFTPLPVSMTRTFNLEVALGMHSHWAWALINQIEKRTLAVCDPHDSNAFALQVGNNGFLDLGASATVVVPLDKWLAAGCQTIRWEDPVDADHFQDDALACYVANPIVFGLTFSEHAPLGPSAFSGEIILSHRIRHALADADRESKETNERLCNAFLFILAHELVHVFDSLKFIVPAMIDWDSFYHSALRCGLSCESLVEYMSLHASLLDDYRSETEYNAIRQWWPSYAETWINSVKANALDLFEKPKLDEPE